METSSSLPIVSSARTVQRMPDWLHIINLATRPARAVARAAVFLLKVYPMLPSRPVDWVTKEPVIEKVRYPTNFGQAEGDLYRPPGGGPHPGILVCLGVVPFGVNHPQVAVLGKALARAGFAALLYWSPAMRDFRLDPEDVENISLAYHWLIEQPGVDPARSGLLSVTVVAEKGIMADGSTALSFILGLEGGRRYVEGTPGLQGIFVTEQHEVYVTPGLRSAFTLTGTGYVLKGW